MRKAIKGIREGNFIDEDDLYVFVAWSLICNYLKGPDPAPMELVAMRLHEEGELTIGELDDAEAWVTSYYKFLRTLNETSYNEGVRVAYEAYTSERTDTSS